MKKAGDSHQKEEFEKEAIPALTGTEKSGDSHQKEELKKEN